MAPQPQDGVRRRGYGPRRVLVRFIPVDRPARLIHCHRHVHLPLVVLVCRVEHVFPRWRLALVCWKPRARENRSGHCRVAPPIVASARGSFQLSPTKLAIEFFELRRRPRRDCHATCRLSSVQPPSGPMTTPPANGARHGSPRSPSRGCRKRANELEEHRVARARSGALGGTLDVQLLLEGTPVPGRAR